MGPKMSESVPGAIILVTYAIKETDDRDAFLNEIQNSITGGIMVDVDHLVFAFQEPIVDPTTGRRGLSQVQLVSTQLNEMAQGPYGVNLKELKYYAICKGKLSDNFARKIKEFVALETREREMLNSLVIPVHGTLANSVKR